MKFEFEVHNTQFKYVVVEANNLNNAERLLYDQLPNIDWSEVESTTDFWDFKDENGLTMRDYENIAKERNFFSVDDYLPPYIDQQGY